MTWPFKESDRRSREDAQREHEDAERAHRDEQREHRDERIEHHDARRHDDDEQKESALLRELVRLTKDNNRLLQELVNSLHPKLSSIKIHFEGTPMPVGPVVITVGQNVTATVVGFDQNGAPFAGVIPTPAFAVDNPAVATVDASSGLTTGIAAGVANATATVVSAEGLTLTDTETITVTGVVPVLSSIKISFD